MAASFLTVAQVGPAWFVLRVTPDATLEVGARVACASTAKVSGVQKSRRAARKVAAELSASTGEEVR